MSATEQPAAAPAAAEVQSVEPVVKADVPPTDAAPVTTTAAAETTPAAAVSTETPAATTDAAAAPAAVAGDKTTTKADEKPVSEGTLGYKAPGLLKSLKFSKRQFWLGDEPVDHKSLNNYLRGEKAEVAHPTAAWSSHTGKGLLFFTRPNEKKEAPAGVLNLAHATDLTKDGFQDFFFKLHGHKHSFQAGNSTERDRWHAALQTAIDEAKKIKEEVTSSDKYKETIAHLGKPTVAVGAAGAGAAAAAATTKEEAAPKKSSEATAAEGTPRINASDDETDKEGKKGKSKSRSASRGNKRNSLFGGFMKKDDDKEEKKLEKKEAKEEKKAEKKEEKAEKKAEEKHAEEAAAGAAGTAVAAHEVEKKHEDKKVEETPAAAPVAPVEPVKEPVAAAAPAADATVKTDTQKSKSEKRGSVFGGFFDKVRSPTREKKAEEVQPALPPKDEVKTSDEAPKLDNPVAETKPEVPAKDDHKEGEEVAAVAAAGTGAAVVADKEEHKKEKKEEKKEKPTLAQPGKERKGSFFENLKSKAKDLTSPTTEKKEHEVAPVVASKDAPEIPPVDTATPAETMPLATEGEVKKDAEIAAVPAAGAAAVTEAETKKPAATDAAVTADKPTAATAEPAVKTNGTSPAAAPEKEKRRTSLFGMGSQKKAKEGSSESGSAMDKLGGLFRKGSQAVRSKSPSAPVKDEKKTEAVAEEKTDAAAAETPAATATETPAAGDAKVTPVAPESPAEEQPHGAIGDVVPAAVTRGDENKVPEVAASA